MQFFGKEQAMSKCKGLFFRGSVSRYVSGLRIVDTRQVKFLKKPSCTGCGDCGWFWDVVGDEMSDGLIDLSHLEHNKMYRVRYVFQGLEESHIEFLEVSDV